MTTTDTIAFRSYVEEIPDHECGLDLKNVVEDVLYGGQFPTRRQRFQKTLKRWCLPSRMHPHTTRFFKSTASLSAEIIRHSKNSPRIIHPFSISRCNWELFMIVVYTLVSIFFPFYWAFVKTRAEEVKYEEGGIVKDYEELSEQTIDQMHRKSFSRIISWNNLIILLCTMIIIDIVINFNTGYVTRDCREIVLDRKRIARHYAMTFLFIDLLFIIHAIYILGGVATLVHTTLFQWIELIMIVRYVRICSLLQYFRRAAERFHFGPAITRLVPAFFLTFITIHFFACINLTMDLPYPGHHNVTYKSWIASKKLFHHWNSSTERIWRISILRTASLLFGVNQAYPYMMEQDIGINVAISIIGFILVFYLLYQIIILTKIYNAAKSRYEEMQLQLVEFVKYKQVPLELEKRLMEFYRYCFQTNFYREPDILDFLSGQLKQEVLLHSCRRLVEIVPFFFNVPPHLMIRVVSCLVREIVLANDVVMKVGMPGDSMYFISSGSVAVYTAHGSELCHLKEGEHFGEIALVSENNHRIATVVAVETSELYSLSRDDFLYAVAPDPELLASIRRTAVRRQLFTDSMQRHSSSSKRFTRTSLTPESWKRKKMLRRATVEYPNPHTLSKSKQAFYFGSLIDTSSRSPKKKYTV